VIIKLSVETLTADNYLRATKMFMTTYFHDPTKITAQWAISSFFLFPVHAYSHAYTNTHTHTKGASWTRDKEIMPNKECSGRWAKKWLRKSSPHYIKIIIRPSQK